MRKISSIILAIACLLVTFTAPQTTYAFFADIQATNPYSDAINYLESYNIIKGYEDGTFKPDNPVSRAEFLKIIVLSSGYDLNSTSSISFKDVPENAWYTPYVKKAASEGIITGYKDGTFRPAQPINQAEALKIIGIAQKWKIVSTSGEWYLPYSNFAQQKYLIDENVFNPNIPITRGLTSEIIYRTSKQEIFKIVKVQNAPTTPTTISTVNDVFKPIITPTIPQMQAQSPVAFSTINKNFFDGITLDSDFQTIFYKNEVYKFKGTITSGTFSTIFAFLSYKDAYNNDKSIEFSVKVENGSFEIPVIFRYPGNYLIGIIPGTQGSSKVVNISVLDSTPSVNSGEQAGSAIAPRIYSSGNKTYIPLNKDEKTTTKITFSQNTNSFYYIVRQKEDNFEIFFEDFYKFSPGTVRMVIDNNGTASETTFLAIRHLFEKNNQTKISSSGLQTTIPFARQIIISGITNTDILEEAHIIKPNGTVESLNITSPSSPMLVNGENAFKKGSQYALSYTPTTSGTYVLGISEVGGETVINTPIYIGTGIPFLPDFSDIEKIDSNPDTTITDAQNKFINWTNTARQNLGLQAVSVDTKLNELAQKHSDDMAKNAYFSHINLQGQTPNDRRIALNISTEVGENIARVSSLAEGFEGFMRSPSHRKNVLYTDWTKVGFGFTKDAQGLILITEEFSKNPLTLQDIPRLTNELLSYINTKRQAAGLSDLISDTNLSVIAASWSDKMAQSNFTAFTSPNTGESLQDDVKKLVSSQTIKLFIYSQNTTNYLNENINKQINLLDQTVSKIGIGLRITTLGEIKLTIILT
ncbi:MAG: Oligopeptide ABC transporter substrate binding protein [Candidatus Peregrinibacteria bacterium GW2011_GWA2_38_36]|nr:MAG: Oligopeptide ABC transporter substrate binding protein [Candidatus Peregrinibacteria bacterium GW2011_GWA2_38_36]